jgi:transcriptional regulator with XRE-family HTH domain
MIEANLEIFADNVKILMKQKGIADYNELAEQLDVEAPRAKRWLEGGCFPQHPMMVRLMKFFEVSDYQLLLTRRIGHN